MKTQNNSSSSNSIFFASPFAALTMTDNGIKLDGAAEKAAPEAAKPAIAIPQTLRVTARRLPSLPARGRTPQAVTSVQNSPAPVTAPTPTAEPAPFVVLTGWQQLQGHMSRGTTVRGTVLKVIHSKADGQGIVGIKVRVCGLEAFAPYRMLGLCPLDTEHSVTLEKGFRVVEMVKGEKGEKDRIILNHNLVLTAERSAELIRKTKVGDTVSGIIRNLKPFGAFVDIGGASALIHVNDLPLGRLSRVKVGQAVTATVVNLDPQSGKIGLSMKSHFLRELKAGVELSGKVKNHVSYGCFVELGGTVDGLVHVSKLGGKNPAVGESVTVKVLSTDLVRGQIQLALVG